MQRLKKREREGMLYMQVSESRRWGTEHRPRTWFCIGVGTPLQQQQGWKSGGVQTCMSVGLVAGSRGSPISRLLLLFIFFNPNPRICLKREGVEGEREREREREGEGERDERETLIGCLSQAPRPGIEPAT